MKPVKRTKGSLLSDAEICRRNGWISGTRLRCGRATLEITAVGREKVLAVWNKHDMEWDTCLRDRNWRVA